VKYLLLMRHAKSSWKEGPASDHARTLNKRGKRDAPRMGFHIREQGLLLDAVLCSTAVRARETAVAFLESCTFEGEVHYFDDLYQADPEVITTLLQQLPGTVETALVIGHNPGLEVYLEMVCGESEHMPTACVAYIRFALDRWADITGDTPGELLQIWKPKEI
jgi:phosphohistidine phosphatase